MADAVVAYQMTLLKAVDGVNARIESIDSGASPESGSPEGEGSHPDSDTEARKQPSSSEIKTGNQVVDNIGQKVFEIETAENTLEKELDMMMKDMTNLITRWNTSLVSHPPSPIQHVFVWRSSPSFFLGDIDMIM